MKIKFNHYSEYIKKLSPEDRKKLEEFFKDFKNHCLINRNERRKLREDFENVILYYLKNGKKLDDILKLIDVTNLGGFYARTSTLWFPLDDAAKIYPLSMEHGRMSIFRLSVYLKEDVVPEILQMALNFTIKRFPTFATTIKKGFFWHYLDVTKRRYCVEKESDIPSWPLKISKSGSQSFRVIYHNNRVSVEIFHVLTDGTGGMEFLKTLLSEYLKLTGVKVEKNDYILDANDIPLAEEFENAFVKVPLSNDSSGFIDKTAVQMSGKLSKVKPCRVVHFKMDANKLKELAKKNNTTITTYFLALMFIANKAATDELTGDISIQVPVSMRKFYKTKTLRNFSMYCGIRVPIEKAHDFNYLIREIDQQLIKKSSLEEMNKMLTSTKKMVNYLKLIPLQIKQPIAKIVYGFLGDKIFSNTLSNLGVVKLPESVLKHIDSMDAILGVSITNRAGCSVVTVNNTTTFSLNKMTKDPTFEDKLYELLVKDGLDVVVEGSEYYEG